MPLRILINFLSSLLNKLEAIDDRRAFDKAIKESGDFTDFEEIKRELGL